jgi:hypothetical protein
VKTHPLQRPDLALLFTGTNDGGTVGEQMRIDSSGRVLIGITTARDDFYQNDVAPSLQVEGSNTSKASISATQNAASADGPRIFLGKTRGTGAQIVSNGDRLGALSMQGADGTDLVPSAEINGYVDGTPGANDMPGRLVCSTTADGASTGTERMRIDQAGNVIIPTAALNYRNKRTFLTIVTDASPFRSFNLYF